MLPEWIVKYIGGGLLIVIVYVIISNTLWLLIGARALQFLPGVNDKSAKGTLKILVLLVMSLIGVGIWLIKLLPSVLRIIKHQKSLSEEISSSIQKGSKIYSKIVDREK